MIILGAKGLQLDVVLITKYVFQSFGWAIARLPVLWLWHYFLSLFATPRGVRKEGIGGTIPRSPNPYGGA